MPVSTPALATARAVVGALLAGVLGLVGSTALGGPAGAVTDDGAPRTALYLVTFADTPAASYRGGVGDYPATVPARGERFDETRPEVSRYRLYLQHRQDRLLAEVDPQLVPVYRYATVVSGVAVRLSEDQVSVLRGLPDVRAVEPSTRGRLDTVRTPEQLGLDARGGPWQRAGDPENAGAGVVVGVVDSGIWPDNPSFTAPDVSPGHHGLEGFTGGCRPGDGWTADDCDAKIVAARWFVEAFGRDNLSSAEFLSARDAEGHGSHVAGIIAGNHGVRVSVAGQALGTASGVAPGAALGVYKACWTAPDPRRDGCAAADVLRALDQAVADGVDVVSLPVSGPANDATAFQDAVRHATAAGVSVVMSAGNAGPRGVAPTSPWATTAGAATSRAFRGEVVLGDGRRLSGAMVGDRPVDRSPVVLGEDAALSDPRAAARCEPGRLDPAAVANAVVVCERGVVARVDKSRAVHRAGGVGMVLVNPAAGAVEADLHAVPTVHLDQVAGERLLRYVSDAGPRATVALDPGSGRPVPAADPAVAQLSGRGPGSHPNVLKPDLLAPGVSILSAVAPPSNYGRQWDLRSGTSAAAAHVAGLTALLRAEHPSWSPAAVRSALMTTAEPVPDRHGVLAQGAGFVAPAAALDPGLVLDDAPTTGAGQPSGSSSGELPANLPSVVVDELVGTAEVRRTLTNVSARRETYNVVVNGVRGVDVSVAPATLTLGPGESRSVTIRMVATERARFDRYVSGDLTWHGSEGHRVRIPLAVQATRASVPSAVHLVGTSGVIRLRGIGGMTGALPVSVAGLVPAEPRKVVLAPGEFDPAAPAAGSGTHRETFTVPEGTAALRFDADALSATDDLDLYVYRDGRLVARSSGRNADERVTILDPQPGQYDVYTHLRGWPAGATTDGYFTGWVVPDRDTGTLEVPDSVRLRGSEQFRVPVRWDRIDTGQRWFGLVRLGSGDGAVTTTVSVD